MPQSTLGCGLDLVGEGPFSSLSGKHFLDSAAGWERSWVWQEVPSPAQPSSVATCLRLSRGSLLNPRSLIPNPDVLILNFAHVPSLTLRHPSCGPCQPYECRQALLQL